MYGKAASIDADPERAGLRKARETWARYVIDSSAEALAKAGPRQLDSGVMRQEKTRTICFDRLTLAGTS